MNFGLTAPCCKLTPELYQECLQNSRLSKLSLLTVEQPTCGCDSVLRRFKGSPRAPSSPSKTPCPCCEDIAWQTNPQKRLHVELMRHLLLETFRANLIRPYHPICLPSHCTHFPTQKCSNTNAAQFPTSSET